MVGGKWGNGGEFGNGEMGGNLVGRLLEEMGKEINGIMSWGASHWFISCK